MTMAGLDVTELFELALLLVAVGALSGFLAGVFGIGGGAVLVPVSTNAFGSPACRSRCGCRFASAPRSRSSSRPRSAPIAPITPAAR